MISIDLEDTFRLAHDLVSFAAVAAISRLWIRRGWDRSDWATCNPHAAPQEFPADLPELRAEAPPGPFEESERLPGEEAIYSLDRWLRQLC